VMLRDPVERFCSGIAHQWREGAPRNGSTTAEAIERGFYHHAMRGWWELFEDSRILVLQYERCVADPVAQIAATYRFLGLDDSFEPAGLRRKVSVTGHDKPNLDEDVRRRLVEIYTHDVMALAARLPELDLSLWSNFAGVTLK